MFINLAIMGWWGGETGNIVPCFACWNKIQLAFSYHLRFSRPLFLLLLSFVLAAAVFALHRATILILFDKHARFSN